MFKYVYFIIPIFFLVFTCKSSETSATEPDDISSSSSSAGYVEKIIPGISNQTLVKAPGGTFPQQDTNNNTFSHTISEFYLSKYEVTYEVWYIVITNALSNGYSFKNLGTEGNTGTVGAAPTAAKDEPVGSLNWRDAIVWCNAYSMIVGLTPVYTNTAGLIITNSTDLNGTECDNAGVKWDADGYRLPTESESRYAARYIDGVSWTHFSNASGATEPYNNTSACLEVAWYSGNSGSETHPVGLKKTNQLGIYDMSGNVREWCWDWEGTWPASATTDYRGPVSGTTRIYRNGDYNNINFWLQLGLRTSIDPSIGNSLYGLRVARSK